MSDARSQLLNAGLEVIAAQGMGGLTHEAVDTAAHAPPGSAEETFPTQKELLEGVTQRAIERELAMAGGPGLDFVATREGVATAFGTFALRAVGEDRAVTLARYALHAQAANNPALRTFYAVGADEVDTTAIDIFRRAGSRHPERDFGILANYMTGLVFHELALPTPGFDPVERARVLIDILGWSTP